jgi:hypothetical protein
MEAETVEAHPGSPHEGLGARTIDRAPVEVGGREVSLGRIRLVAPEHWVRKPSRSRFFLAEFSLPRADGDAQDGHLTVTAVGGSVEENVARWRRQFGGKPEQEAIEEIEVAGVRVTLVDFSGTYSDQHGGIAPGTELPRSRMLAAIFDLPGQQHIVKCYGPEKTMAAEADAFLAFIGSPGPTGDRSSEPETTTAEPETPAAEPETLEQEPAEADSSARAD